MLQEIDLCKFQSKQAYALALLRQAGWLAGWLAGKQADEIQVISENFKIYY